MKSCFLIIAFFGLLFYFGGFEGILLGIVGLAIVAAFNA
jgi:hypothetical protein